MDDLYNQIDQLLWDDLITIPLFQFPDFQANREDISIRLLSTAEFSFLQ
jgi:hypothetical protein